jgi:predicted ATPase/DNA-binding NarL/FixJ family response regulator
VTRGSSGSRLRAVKGGGGLTVAVPGVGSVAERAAVFGGEARGALPVWLTSFVGRGGELAAVGELLVRSRLVTLTGPAGVGKTRLAVEVARRRAVGRGAAVVFVDLAPVGDGSEVALRIADAVRLQGSRGDLLGGLVHALGGVRQLLLLDNCEQVVDGCAQVTASLLGECPRLRVLATSREALRLDGEAVLPVEPLPLEEARRLFVERARAKGASVEVARDAAVGGLCRRLDGIPLALELAAARAAAISPGEMLELLDDRFSLLSAGSRLAVSRHRTLRGAVEWSYELLEPGERGLFARLAVFSGSFTAASAGAVAEANLEGLASLVEKSMVHAFSIAGGPTRYRLLETLRAYALERLGATGEEPVLRRRLLEHLLERAQRGWRERPFALPEACVLAFGDDLDDLRAAARWSIDEAPEAGLSLLGHTPWVWFRMAGSDGLALAVRLLGLHPARDSDRALGLMTAGFCAMTNMDHAAAAGYFDEAQELARELDRVDIDAWCEHPRGASAMLTGRLADAARLQERAMELAVSLDDQVLAGRATVLRAAVDYLRGDHSPARALLGQALEALEPVDDPWGQGLCHNYFGLSHKATGDERDARRHLTSAIGLLSAARDVNILGQSLAAYAVLLVRSEPGRALRIASATVAGGRDRRYAPWTIADLESVRAAGQAALGQPAAEHEWEAGATQSLAEAAELVLKHSTPKPRTAGTLTEREAQVAALVADGLSNAMIAARLHLSERTIENHVAHALAKTGGRNRAELAAWITTHAG